MDAIEDLRDRKEVERARVAFGEFGTCLSDLESSLRRALRAFAEYHAADAKMTREQWSKWIDGETPSQEYIDGYNAGVESILLSVDTFLDEHKY